ncbi:hypothetical protein CDAR_238591, partial [Caerostris darwini]
MADKPLQYRLSLPETTDPLTSSLYHENPPQSIFQEKLFFKICRPTFPDDHPFICLRLSSSSSSRLSHYGDTKQLSMTDIYKTRPPNCHGRQVPSISSVPPRDHRSFDIMPLSRGPPS